MKIYLVQHGEAVSEDVDPERPLSEAGQADIKRLASFLGEQGIQVSRILHSGKTRARQSAELLAEKVAVGREVQAREGLKPKDSANLCSFKLEQYAEDLMIVSHLPFLGKLVSCLVTEREDIDVIAFHPGTLICLNRGEQGNWVIAWMISPELLQQRSV